ncbi:hypothetical protein J6590_047667 [Homalodisca vitripennis]|nr:hypothetical protein J6590_047667 [Homalodisca vitripennis]
MYHSTRVQASSSRPTGARARVRNQCTVNGEIPVIPTKKYQSTPFISRPSYTSDAEEWPLNIFFNNTPFGKNLHHGYRHISYNRRIKNAIERPYELQKKVGMPRDNYCGRYGQRVLQRWR